MDTARSNGGTGSGAQQPSPDGSDAVSRLDGTVAAAQKDPNIAIAAEGALLQAMAQATKIVCSFVGTVVLVRLLDPTDFGVIAMAAPFVGFLALFQNLGLNQAVIQARDLDERRSTALFLYNLVAAAVLACLLVALAPVIASFYGVPEVGAVIVFSSVTLLVTALSMQHAALGARQMRFALLSGADVLANVVGLLVTIGLALWLRSFWALAIGGLAGAVMMTLLLWARIRWRPVRDVDFAGARDMFTFGANLTGFNVVNFLVRNADNVMIGRFWGPGQLGFYDRSYRIMMFPVLSVNAPLGKIMLPTLARLNDQPERYRRAYVTAIRSLALVSMPGVLAAAICSEEVVGLLLGSKWQDAAPIFRWLSLAALLAPVTHTTGWLFISSNRAKALLRWGLLSAGVTLAAFAAGLPWRAEGVAFAFFCSQTLLIPFLYRRATRDTPVRQSDLYLCLLPTVLGAAVAWPAHLLLERQMSPLGITMTIIVLAYGAGLAGHRMIPEGRELLHRQARMVILGLSRFRRVRLQRSAVAT